MAIGIGLHCWYCDHGPCDRTCLKDQVKTKQEVRDEKLKKILEDTDNSEEVLNPQQQQDKLESIVRSMLLRRKKA
jgi:hypothetical protein